MNRALLCAAVLVFTAGPSGVQGQPAAQTQPSSIPTIRITSRLVFLDVTVLDRKGHPVVTGLTKDDFLITEDNQPQQIFSFEAPDAHTESAGGGDDSSEGKAPVTVFVLDLLNSNFSSFAVIRDQVRRYLDAQPSELPAAAELLVLGNESLEPLQGWTRHKEDLLDALRHIRPVMQWKRGNRYAFEMERLGQSIDALDQIAYENQAVPGRKNVLWVGPGAPALSSVRTAAWEFDELDQALHATANRLVDGRISLFVISPGIGGGSAAAKDAASDPGDADPFQDGVNFGVITNLTGGEFFENRNDVDAEMRQAERFGSEYYTLTYQPQDGNDDGLFRRIRVTLRDPNLRAVTKTGYFGPDRGRVDAQGQARAALGEAAHSTIPFVALGVSIGNIVRHPDSQTAQFTLYLRPRDLGWRPGPSGTLGASVTLASASLGKNRKILAWRAQTMDLASTARQPAQLQDTPIPFRMTLRFPRNAQSLRVVAEAGDGGRMGTAEVARAAIEAAPTTSTPNPRLSPARRLRPSP